MRCSGRACYLNSIALASKIALNTDGNLLIFIDGLFVKKTDPDQIVDTAGSYFSKMTSGITSITESLIYYDNHCSSNTYDAGRNSCITKGLRFAELNETTASAINGIPACSSSAWTWTQTYAGGNSRFVWTGNSSGPSGPSVRNIRCVK